MKKHLEQVTNKGGWILFVLTSICLEAYPESLKHADSKDTQKENPAQSPNSQTTLESASNALEEDSTDSKNPRAPEENPPNILNELEIGSDDWKNMIGTLSEEHVFEALNNWEAGSPDWNKFVESIPEPTNQKLMQWLKEKGVSLGSFKKENFNLPNPSPKRENLNPSTKPSSEFTNPLASSSSASPANFSSSPPAPPHSNQNLTVSEPPLNPKQVTTQQLLEDKSKDLLEANSGKQPNFENETIRIFSSQNTSVSSQSDPNNSPSATAQQKADVPREQEGLDAPILSPSNIKAELPQSGFSPEAALSEKRFDSLTQLRVPTSLAMPSDAQFADWTPQSQELKEMPARDPSNFKELDFIYEAGERDISKDNSKRVSDAREMFYQMTGEGLETEDLSQSNEEGLETQQTRLLASGVKQTKRKLNPGSEKKEPLYNQKDSGLISKISGKFAWLFQLILPQ